MSYLNRVGLRAPNYDTAPTVRVPAAHAASCRVGWDDIAAAIRSRKENLK